MAYSSYEVKSGIFITSAIVLLLGLTFIVGKFAAGSTQPYQVRFGYISGLEANAPVYFAGREVGKVDKIEILKGEERPILIKVRVSEQVLLRADTNAYIDTLGMMGEKFLELSPGTANAAPLPTGSEIKGTDPIPMHVLVRKMNLLADRMDDLTVSLNPLMTRVGNLVAGHEEEIAKTIANIHEVSANLRDMTHDLKTHPWRILRKG